ncbi:MAG TPA: hypothetical protein VN661_06930 [Candidatus Acidoferrales bacterium]|nr:hypothetical protein [Candidatus Acidoferrales bacterium]
MKRAAVLIPGLLVALAGQASGQSSARAKWAPYCPALTAKSASDLTAFLKKTTPDAGLDPTQNNWCITYAVAAVAADHFEPAIPAVVKFVGFSWPPLPGERTGTWDHLPALFQNLPAVTALRWFGKPALPEILKALKAGSMSSFAQQAAAYAWFGIYNDHEDNVLQGFVVLSREAAKATDDSVRERLQNAIQQGLGLWCRSDNAKANCRQAVADGARQ